jgi:uracil-DNA glycosylase
MARPDLPQSILRSAPIIGASVPAAWPSDPTDSVFVALYGEAPGRHGADKSGIPFWGDRAARVCYAALAAADAASWQGGMNTLKLLGLELIRRDLRPTLYGVMLSNAYDRCPAASLTRIRPPTSLELQSESNRARLREELSAARSRGCHLVVAMGRIAGQVLSEALITLPPPPEGRSPMALVIRPHPSAQGLLQAAPDRGRGCKMVDLEAAWVQQTAELIRGASSVPNRPRSRGGSCGALRGERIFGPV